MLPARSPLSPRTHWRNPRRVRRRASGRSFTYNLRFPGQVFDGQAGLHQNYFRDYDPAVGNFLEPDPTGLTRHITDPLLKLAMRISAGSPEERDPGLNFPYAYVGANPVSFVDPQGTDRYDRSRDRPERERPETPRDPPDDDWRGQCIMLYTMCIQERWIGPCVECLNKCTSQKEWPFRGAPPACRPRPPSSCPKP